MDRETFRGKALAEPRTRHAHEFERMTAFAQREHFLERPMLLTAPAVGRFAVQNSQRFHCDGELRVNLASFGEWRRHWTSGRSPVLHVLHAQCQRAESRAPGRLRL